LAEPTVEAMLLFQHQTKFGATASKTAEVTNENWRH
jgi:hypothetical protein